MKKNELNRPSDAEPRRISLPGFVIDEEIGLGTVVMRATSYFRIKPCGGCDRRAIALNRQVVFTNRRQD